MHTKRTALLLALLTLLSLLALPVPGHARVRSADYPAMYELTVDGRGGREFTFATLAEAMAFAGTQTANITMSVTGSDETAQKMTLERGQRIFLDGDIHIVLGRNDGDVIIIGPPVQVTVRGNNDGVITIHGAAKLTVRGDKTAADSPAEHTAGASTIRIRGRNTSHVEVFGGDLWLPSSGLSNDGVIRVTGGVITGGFKQYATLHGNGGVFQGSSTSPYSFTGPNTTTCQIVASGPPGRLSEISTWGAPSTKREGLYVAGWTEKPQPDGTRMATAYSYRPASLPIDLYALWNATTPRLVSLWVDGTQAQIDDYAGTAVVDIAAGRHLGSLYGSVEVLPGQTASLPTDFTGLDASAGSFPLTVTAADGYQKVYTVTLRPVAAQATDPNPVFDLSPTPVPDFVPNAKIARCDEYVNLRAGPGMAYEVIGRAFEHGEVMIRTSQDGWVYAVCNGGADVGWINEGYIDYLW